MINIIITTEEIVTREISVLVPDGTPDPEGYAEQKFWNGEYDGSLDVDRRGERIINMRVGN